MKLKHRSNLFLVVREYGDTEMHKGTKPLSEVPISGFLTMERADEYAGVCQQDYEERNIEGFVFKVVPLIYYDE